MADDEHTIARVSPADIEAAARRVRPHVHRTPIFGSHNLSSLLGSTILLKAENLQKTGSFKARGGTNAILSLSADQRARGVIAVSAGNHAAGVAYGAGLGGVRATVVMPETAVPEKIAAVESYGAHVRLVDPARLMERTGEIQRDEGQIFLHPFDEPTVIAGQGTVGMEIVDDVPDVDLVVVPVGGGGLISGVAAWLKHAKPSVSVIGVEPSGSNVVSQSLAAGHPVTLHQFQSIADGLNAPWSGPVSLRLIQQLVDDVVTVTDSAIGAAMRIVMERTKLIVEPAGAAGIAGLLEGSIPNAEGKRIVVILSGGNVGLSRLGALLTTPVS